MTTVLASIRDLPNNPVLRREMDERSSSTMAILAVTLWMFSLGGLATLVYVGYTFGNVNPVTTDSARIGRQIFSWTLFGMLGLVLFLIPAFTASSVAGERTRQTLVPLQVTAMGPLAIVLGKALASIVFTLLLIVATSPILALAFFVGGVGIRDLFGGLGMVMLTAVMLGSVGIMFSAIARKVQGAIVATYGYVIAIVAVPFVVFGTGVLLLGLIALSQDPYALDNTVGTDMPPRQILAVSPFVGLASGASSSAEPSFAENPIDGIDQIMRDFEAEAQVFDNPQLAAFEPVSASWRWYVLFCVLTIYVSLSVATDKLRTPAQFER